MTNENKMEWDSKYSVDIPEIDNHQKKMFELFNDLLELKSTGSDSKECINMITSLNDYSKLYFATEERMLKKKKYPDLLVHAKEHRKFTKRFIALRRELSEDIENLTDESVIELRDWLLDHILSLDSLYIPYLRITRYVDDCRKQN